MSTASTAKSVPETSSKKSGKKKKEAPFLEREVKIGNVTSVNHKFLLETMHKRFQKGFKRWKSKSTKFKIANLIVVLIVVLVQVVQLLAGFDHTTFQVRAESVSVMCATNNQTSQVVLFQLSSTMVSTSLKKSIATILPTVTGAILAIQMKLAWADKGAKCKKSAVIFNKLANHTEYRMTMLEAGGYFEDVTQIWNTGLVSESKDIPAYLMAY